MQFFIFFNRINQVFFAFKSEIYKVPVYIHTCITLFQNLFLKILSCQYSVLIILHSVIIGFYVNIFIMDLACKLKFFLSVGCEGDSVCLGAGPTNRRGRRGQSVLCQSSAGRVVVPRLRAVRDTSLPAEATQHPRHCRGTHLQRTPYFYHVVNL